MDLLQLLFLPVHILKDDIIIKKKKKKKKKKKRNKKKDNVCKELLATKNNFSN